MEQLPTRNEGFNKYEDRLKNLAECCDSLEGIQRTNACVPEFVTPPRPLVFISEPPKIITKKRPEVTKFSTKNFTYTKVTRKVIKVNGEIVKVVKKVTKTRSNV